MKTYRAVVGMAAGAALVLSGCGSTGDRAPVGVGAGGPSGTYVSQGGKELVAGTSVRLDLSDGRVTASAGCNTVSGKAEVGGDKVTVSELATTEMGCEAPRQAQDEWLTAFLASGPSWRTEGEKLVLESSEGELVLGREELPPLIGTTWTVNGFVQGETASSPVGSGPSDAGLVFEAETVQVRTGCNTGTAPYKVSGEALVFEPPVLTKMACVDPAMAQAEQALTSLLDGRVEMTVRGKTMTLVKDGQGVMFTAS